MRTCHRRGAHAIGGMAAFIPNRRDPAVTERGAGARSATTRSARAGDGFDGTWVAHPDLVPVATEVFDRVLGDRPNQKERLREEVSVDGRRAARPARRRAARSPRPASGPTSGSRWPTSTRWLRGVGAAAIDNLMEDAATAEISRSQLWHWRTRGVALDDGRVVRRGPVRGDPRRGAGAARRGRGGAAGRGGRAARSARPRRRLRRVPDAAGVLAAGLGPGSAPGLMLDLRRPSPSGLGCAIVHAGGAIRLRAASGGTDV